MPVAFPLFPVVSAGVINDCSSLQTLLVCDLGHSNSTARIAVEFGHAESVLRI